MMIYIFYTHKIVVGLTPMALRYRSLIRYTRFPYLLLPDISKKLAKKKQPHC
jgi:hypothetical protein